METDIDLTYQIIPSQSLRFQ